MSATIRGIMDWDYIILNFGYLGLFVISVLAASIIPFSTEAVVVIMPSFGFNIFLVGLVATVGNYVGAATVYWMGLKGREYVIERVKIKPERIERAERWFAKYGPPTLLLSWVPFLGDPLCGVAGILEMNFTVFSIWTFLGKGIRYVVLLGALEWITPFFTGG